MRNIRKYRGALGLTQKELAKIIGISPVTMGKIESDTRYNPKRETVLKLADFFQCGTYELCDVKDSVIVIYPPRNDRDRQKLRKLLREAEI